MNKIIKKEVTDNGTSYQIDFGGGMVLWFDTWVENKELTGDWNMYIFHTKNKKDMAIKAFQENCENFQTAIELCAEI